MILLSLLLALVLWLAPAPTHAVIAVEDIPNLTQNTVTAIQSVLSVLNQILELTGLGEIVLDGGDYAEDLDQLAGIVEEARGLSYDLASLQAQITLLFDLNTAPHSTSQLRKRLAEIRRVVWESNVYALRTQTLLRTTLSTVRHLTRLVSAIGGFAGNNQGNQTIAQLDSSLSKQLAILQTQTAAAQRAETIDRLTQPLMDQSWQYIYDEIMSDYPK